MPTVSVLLPVRNGAVHLDEALASMAAQTLDDFELVAVDDGSTDATPDLLADWAARDPRLRVVRQEAAGIVAALERARREARSPYLARMDADDVAEPRRLEAQLALMEAEPGLSGCGCLVRYFPRSRVRAGARRYEAWINDAVTPEEIERSVFVECPLAHPTFFLRAHAVEAVGGYQAFDGPEDYDLVLRMWSEGHRFGKVPEVLMRWREGPDRLSRTDPRYAPEAFLATKLRHLRATLLRDGGSVVIWGAGPVGKGWSKALRRADVGLAAFVEVDPRKIGQEIHGAPVWRPDELRSRQEPYVLAAVGSPGARSEIREALASMGRRELVDYRAVA